MKRGTALLAFLGVMLGVVAAWAWTRPKERGYRVPTEPQMPRARLRGLVLVLGDSLTGTAGYCSGLLAGLPSGSTVTCRSYPGETTGAIARHLGEIEGQFTDLVVLAGVNDLTSYGAARGLEKAMAGLDSIYRDAKARGMRVVALTLTPWGLHPKGVDMVSQTREINDWIRHHPDVDQVVETAALGDTFGNLYSGYAGGADGLHLNLYGGAELARLVLRQAFEAS